jgi:hypothetical protein
MDDREPWHLDKRVPIALVVMIALQTGAAIWFAAQLDARVRWLETSVISTTSTTDNNRRDIVSVREQAARQDEKLNAIVQILARIDSRLERMEASQ